MTINRRHDNHSLKCTAPLLKKATKLAVLNYSEFLFFIFNCSLEKIILHLKISTPTLSKPKQNKTKSPKRALSLQTSPEELGSSIDKSSESPTLCSLHNSPHPTALPYTLQPARNKTLGYLHESSDCSGQDSLYYNKLLCKLGH